MTFLVIFFLAWRSGRTYCNTICPVGTVLGLVSRYSLFRPTIATEKCTSCGLCSRQCKASCIDSKSHTIDHSRCVTCMNCLEVCNRNAITYAFHNPFAKKAAQGEEAQPAEAMEQTSAEGNSRRDFLTTAGLIVGMATIKAQEKKFDGGLAAILDKEAPVRDTPVVPAGALGINNLAKHCTGCQLCVSACPNDVLRPSSDIVRLMQPESSFERGYCRPECTRCSEVCPTGAIRPITVAEKSSIKTGHAVWIKSNCIPLTRGHSCGNCARHCPTGAIQMVSLDENDPEALKVPVVNDEKCIGCGACENLCPARPFSAIYVEGHENHRYI